MRASVSALARARRFLRSNLLGLLAIFIVLGGTAIALPGKNRIDSGDIKQGQVRTLDLHRGAVTKSKLHRNSVDSSNVRNDSLSSEDIDESTLGLPLGAGVVGEREEADRERRIAIPPGALLPQSEEPNEEPQIFVNLGLQQAAFFPEKDNEAAAIFEVPLDRAEGSGLQVRLLWSTGGTAGNVVWNVGFQRVGPGAPLAGAATGPDVTASHPGGNTMVETTVLDIPAGVVDDGEPVGLTIARNADAPADTLSVFARLRLVEIRYTATG